MKKEKIYNYSELEHLKIPTYLRQYIRQRCVKLEIKLNTVKVRMPESNYITETKVITHNIIEKIENDKSEGQRLSKKAFNLHNIKCYMNDNKEDLLLRGNGLPSLAEQSKMLGRTESYFASHKSQNSKFYRYMRFIGRGNFYKACIWMEKEFQKMNEFIYNEQNKFVSESSFNKAILEKYREKYNKNYTYQNLVLNINSIYMTNEPKIKLFKNARRIIKLIGGKRNAVKF